MGVLLGAAPASGGGSGAAEGPAPSPWLTRHLHLLRPGGRVLDVACGRGRHVRWLAARGYAVTGVDRDGEALEACRLATADTGAPVELVAADLEAAPWPLPGRCFDAVLVTNYLWRPLWPALRAALDPSGGVLLIETFAAGQQHLGRPTRADFLLRPGELLRAFDGLRIVAYEDGLADAPPRCVQRLAAVAAPDGADGRDYPLAAASQGRPERAGSPG